MTPCNVGPSHLGPSFKGEPSSARGLSEPDGPSEIGLRSTSEGQIWVDFIFANLHRKTAGMAELFWLSRDVKETALLQI